MESLGMAQLKRHEGKRSTMYLDALGVPSIGYGHNLRDVPLSTAALDQIFSDDLREVIRQLSAHAWVRGLDEARRWTLYNMGFNLGVPGLMGFVQTIAYIKSGQYEAAAKAMLESRWAAQVGARAVELAEQMRTGVWQ